MGYIRDSQNKFCLPGQPPHALGPQDIRPYQGSCVGVSGAFATARGPCGQ